MQPVPAYVSVVFILTTSATVTFLILAMKGDAFRKLPSQVLICLLPLWMIITGVLAAQGFYGHSEMWPPRIVVFAIFPALLTILLYFILFRKTFIDQLRIRDLTILHIVRIPVEIVLLWLFLAGGVPRSMTFEGRNLDILSGILAPIICFVAFRTRMENRWLIIAYNVLGLGLLINIVSIAVQAMPSPVFDPSSGPQNLALQFFPYIWLPAVVVPIVLFSHLAALWKLVVVRDER